MLLDSSVEKIGDTTEGVIFGPENKPDDYVEIDRNKPYIKKKYPKFNKSLFNELKKYENPNWPSQEECKKYVLGSSLKWRLNASPE